MARLQLERLISAEGSCTTTIKSYNLIINNSCLSWGGGGGGGGEGKERQCGNGIDLTFFGKCTLHVHDISLV